MTIAPLRCVLAALLVLGMTAGITPAGAHTALTETDPPADATLQTGPARVTATFNEELQPTFAAMTVIGPDGNLWSGGDQEVRGLTVTVPVRPLGPAGRYTVNYRVTSADGHVVTGSWSFTVAVPSTGEPGPTVPSPGGPGRISLWPFGLGAVLLIGVTALWVLRHRANEPRQS